MMSLRAITHNPLLHIYICAVQGLAGAMLHTIRCQVACSGIQLLPALADYLTLVALAPSIGAEAAMAVLGEDSAS